MTTLPNYATNAANYEKLDLLNQLQSVLEIIVKNLELYLSPNATKLTFINPDLYRLAQQYYGDATLWTAIAQANGLFDPQYDGQIDLFIPEQPGIDTGGVLSV